MFWCANFLSVVACFVSVCRCLLCFVVRHFLSVVACYVLVCRCMRCFCLSLPAMFWCAHFLSVFVACCVFVVRHLPSVVVAYYFLVCANLLSLYLFLPLLSVWELAWSFGCQVVSSANPDKKIGRSGLFCFRWHTIRRPARRGGTSAPVMVVLVSIARIPVDVVTPAVNTTTELSSTDCE